MYRKLTSEAGLLNNVYNDINGKYNNEMVQGLYSKHPRRRSFHHKYTMQVTCWYVIDDTVIRFKYW